jgi:hypothetical protein
MYSFFCTAVTSSVLKVSQVVEEQIRFLFRTKKAFEVAIQKRMIKLNVGLKIS